MVSMDKGAGLLIGGILGLIAGAFFTWLILRQLGTFTAAKKTIENIETWDMWEDENGHLQVEVHRKVQR